MTAVKDSQTTPTGLKVTDEDVARLHLLRDTFHGDWNYPIKPHERWLGDLVRPFSKS